MTIKEVARIAGVSIATVSKVINGCDEHISEATRERVRAVVAKYNYIPNSVARGLKTRKSKIIGILLPDITNPYFPQIVRGIEDAANLRGYGVVFCNTGDNPDREVECYDFLRSKMVDGIIFTRSLKRSARNRVLTEDLPAVVLDRVERDDRADKACGKVYVDVRRTMYDATMKLFQAGCGEIACLSAASDSKSDRFLGYLRALETLDLPYDKSYVFLDKFTEDTGYRGAKAVLEHHPETDGLVCGNDLIAIGALQALSELERQVPRQVKVIGIDNIYFSNFTTPPLSTMGQPTYTMGEAAASMLIDHLEYGKPLFECVFDHEYIQRQTV